MVWHQTLVGHAIGHPLLNGEMSPDKVTKTTNTVTRLFNVDESGMLTMVGGGISTSNKTETSNVKTSSKLDKAANLAKQANLEGVNQGFDNVKGVLGRREFMERFLETIKSMETSNNKIIDNKAN
jgi:hypothetical protein